jgi:hypothetical protein
MKIIDKFWKIFLGDYADMLLNRIIFGILIGGLVLECLILEYLTK